MGQESSENMPWQFWFRSSYTIHTLASMYGLFTLGKKWPHSRGNVGKYFLHEASGILLTSIDCRWWERLSIGLCFKWVVEIIWIWPMTAQWQARNATRILKVYCVYLFFHGRIFRTFVKYVTLTWHGEFFVEAGAQSGFKLSSRASITFKVFFKMISMYSLGCPPIVTTCASSLVLFGDNYWL